MAYLIQDDYSLRINVSNLIDILDQGILGTSFTITQLRQNAESWAMATITGYLTTQYNIQAEFAIPNTGARNFQILQATLDIAIFTLHKTINPRDVPDHVQIAFDNTMKWLDDARAGRTVVALSQAQDPTNPNGTPFQNSFVSSQVKFISKPYQDGQLFDPSTYPGNPYYPFPYFP